jgi:hypothetical protein
MNISLISLVLDLVLSKQFKSPRQIIPEVNLYECTKRIEFDARDGNSS